MSFTKEVKNEIFEEEVQDVAKISLLSAIIFNSHRESEKILIENENITVIRYVFKLIKEVLKVSPKIIVRKGYNYKKSYAYILEIKETDKISKILGISNDVPEEFIIDDENLKRNYIKGVFILCGSINDPKKSRYHLEFLLETEKYAHFFSKLLNEFNLNSKVLKREKKHMVYIKEAEKIGDFLRLLGTTKTLFYYEDMRIYRDHKNMINRLNNCEQANIDKAIIASNNQIKNIELIETVGAINLLDEKLQEIVSFRKKYPDATLQELSEIITSETETKISKSGLNHRFRKIQEFADKIRKKNQDV